MNGKEARPNKETRAEKCLIVESDLRILFMDTEH
ncbi:MAG: hypothetical protein A4E45_00905 [Methanosaeta sp. PtaB.Bin039]|nr:MAG: hypothetical protein A4E45_00905 [Methanosaeta sp. PtaB.Bin039]